MSTQYAYSSMQHPGGYSPYSGISSYQNGFTPAHTMANNNNNGFVFRKRLERVDWRKIASVDVDQISRTLDFNALQENIMNITFCNIEAELDVRLVDPNFTKLFKLAQMTIEYLLHSQDYLAGVVTSLEDKLKLVHEEHETTKSKMESQQKELSEVKKESHKRKKMLAAQQQILHAGSGSYNKCPYCSKAFVNASFLQSHIHRRHGDGIVTSPSQSSPSPVRMNTALEKELTEIKERLRLTESQLQAEKIKSGTSSLHERNITHVLKEQNVNKENIHEHVQVINTSDLEAGEMPELERMREVFMKELKEMNEKYEASQSALVLMEQRYGRRSNLGELRDEVDVEQELLQQQREEVTQMQAHLQKQMEGMDFAMKKRLGKQEQKWQKKVQNMSTSHADELSKLNSALEQSVQALERSKQQGQNGQMKKHQQNVQQLLTQSREKLIKAESKKVSSVSKDEQKKKEKTKKQNTNTKTLATESRERPASATKVTSSPLRAAAPLHTMVEQMSDDDSDDEDEGLDSPFGTGKSLGNTAGTTGELSATQRSNRLLEQLRRDPTILKAMREELVVILDEQLDKKGIPKGTKTINSNILSSKQAILEIERQGKAQKYVSFPELRRRLQRQVDELAKERFKQVKRSPPSSGNRSASNSTFGSARSLNVRQPSPTGNQLSPESRHPRYPAPLPRGPMAQPSQSAPRPAPRATSPWRNDRSAPLQSTGSTTEWTSTNWDSDEESESEEEDQADGQGRLGFPQTSSAPVPRPRTTPSPRASNIMHKPVDNGNVSDWDSDDISDLEELDAKPQLGSSSFHQSKPPVSVSQPRGAKVSELTRSIESQLSGRRVQKPAGAVDIIGRMDSPGFKDDDSFPDVSSLDENNDVGPVTRSNKQSAGRGSYADTELSSNNTYGTSKWGSSSRAASTAAPGSGKDSVVSLTDWDTDFSDI